MYLCHPCRRAQHLPAGLGDIWARHPNNHADPILDATDQQSRVGKQVTLPVSPPDTAARFSHGSADVGHCADKGLPVKPRTLTCRLIRTAIQCALSAAMRSAAPRSALEIAYIAGVY